MQLKNNKQGFTLVEVLVSIIIVAFVSIGIISMQSSFSKSTTSRKMAVALTDVANTELERLRLGDTSIKTRTEYDIGDGKKMNIYTCIVINNNTTPQIATTFTQPLDTDANPCKEVTVRSTDGLIYTSPTSTTAISSSNLKKVFEENRTVTVQTTICKFK